MSDNTDPESTFSKFGIYSLTNSEIFKFPGIEIHFTKISNNVFLYERNDEEGNLVEKTIPTKSEKLDVEICPIRPLNHPARRTSHVYLNFTTPVFLSEGSDATIFVKCPIEIGVFLIHDGLKDTIDWVTCAPNDSRFALYGTPESGVLCKFANSPIVGSYDDSEPYFNGVMKVHLKNELEGGHSIRRVVFPITDNNVYYSDAKVIFDSVNAVLKKRIATQYIDVFVEPIETDWTLSPSYEITTHLKHSEIGVD